MPNGWTAGLAKCARHAIPSPWRALRVACARSLETVWARRPITTFRAKFDSEEHAMKIGQIKPLLAGRMLVLMAPLLVAAPAVAQEAQVDAIEVQTPSGSLVLEFDSPMTMSSAQVEVLELVGPADLTLQDRQLTVVPLQQPLVTQEELVEVGGTIAPSEETVATDTAGETSETATLYPVEGEGGSYKSIFCNIGYSFGDGNGTYSVQRRCGSDKAPWGYKMSPALRRICVHWTVYESGMRWVRNGVRMSQMSPHGPVPCDYHFHGTYTVNRGAKVTYDDSISFRHNMGPGGNATINLSGSLWFRGPKT